MERILVASGLGEHLSPWNAEFAQIDIQSRKGDALRLAILFYLECEGDDLLAPKLESWSRGLHRAYGQLDHLANYTTAVPQAQVPTVQLGGG